MEGIITKDTVLKYTTLFIHLLINWTQIILDTQEVFNITNNYKESQNTRHEHRPWTYMRT